MPYSEGQFVDGRWTPGTGHRVDVVNPFSETVVETVGWAGPDDVDRAVAAARHAFDDGLWRRMNAADSATLLRRVADLLQRDKEEVARVETLDIGKTLVNCHIDVDDVTAAFWWSWPMVFAGQIIVALCFAKLVACYPIARLFYNRSKRFSHLTTAWLARWMAFTTSVMPISAVVLAYQLMLPLIWDGFQGCGVGTGDRDFAVNAVILGTALIVFTAAVTAYGVKLMARIKSARVFIELIVAMLLVVALAINIVNSRSPVRHAGPRR
jgi:hypothetical protein